MTKLEKTTTHNISLIFKIRGDKLITFVTNIDGTLYGIAEKVAVPKTKIELDMSKYPQIDPKVEYKCALMTNDKGGFDVLSLTKLVYPVSVNYIETEDGNKIICQIHNKKIYFDPMNGVTENSSTIQGTIRAIEMCNNNFDKLATIDKVKNLYIKHF